MRVDRFMQFPKHKRVKDLDLLAEYRSMSCAVEDNCCGPIAGHHLKSRGSGGGDVRANLVPLCQRHHTEIHAIGTFASQEKYVSLRIYLKKNCWK